MPEEGEQLKPSPEEKKPSSPESTEAKGEAAFHAANAAEALAKGDTDTALQEAFKAALTPFIYI